MTNRELIQKFETLVTEERRLTRRVLEHIAEIESRRAYLDLGYDGMYAYLTRGLGYSEGAAYRRLQAARLLKTIPVVADKFEAGTLNLTQLAEIAKVSRQTQIKPRIELIEKLETQSKSASEQIIAKEFAIAPRMEIRQRTQQDHSVRLELTFTAEQFATLEKARALISHICPDGAWPEVFAELARRYAKSFEPRPIRTKSRSASSPSPERSPETTPNSIKSRPLKTPPAERRRSIPLTRKRIVFARAGGRCEHVDPRTQRRCGSAYQPQIDHRRPFARGGSHELANLQILCAVHNRAKGVGAEEEPRPHEKRSPDRLLISPNSISKIETRVPH